MGRGGGGNRNSEGMRGTCDWNSKDMGGYSSWDFQRGKSRVCSLKTIILWTFVVSK